MGEHTFLTILLLIGFCVVLPLAMVSVVSDLRQRVAQQGSAARDQGSAIHNPSIE
jgi:hypothetical protein